MQFAKSLFTTSGETSPFRAPPRPSSALDNPWHFAGYASTFPNIDPSAPSFSLADVTLSSTVPVPSGTDSDSTTTSSPLPLCKILQLSSSSTDTSPITPTLLSPADLDSSNSFSSQILIFKYRNTIHAIDHQCPHSSYPLSRGRVGDIEDFGVVLSAEITCPKHGWAFDLHTGKSDRGNYQLKVWEVDVRKGMKGGDGGESAREGEAIGREGKGEGEVDEVWVRKKVKKRQG